ncbi:MAG: DNA-methyltransferase [Planctomycetota bacterium]|jgi:site-specific DNA-methyltransferase (adenine-specific)
MRYEVRHGDCLDIVPNLEEAECIFADPPDNIDLGYGEYEDAMPDEEYVTLLRSWVRCFIGTATTTWISFNAKWLIDMGVIAKELQQVWSALKIKPCVQTFTFGQHNNHDFGNNHRPLWRFKWQHARVYPEQIKVPSWRELHGDKRAKKGGRVPGDVFQFPREIPETLVPDDVFDFPRVTGNSKQRRKWHPTQLHEDLVERCVKSCTKKGDMVIDPFAGTGTTMRVCKRIQRSCITIDLDRDYCAKIAEENGIPEVF